MGADPTFRRPVHLTGLSLLALSFQALGIIYSDLATSPLYVLNGIWPPTGPVPSTEDVIGGISCILWALTILPLLKYAFVALQFGDDEGEGGCFALYHGLLPPDRVTPEEDRTLTCDSTREAPTHSARKQLLRFKWVLLPWALFGTSLTMADGVFTPAVSITSAVGGIAVNVPSVSDKIIPISVGFLAVLFAAQRFGTAGLSLAFSPVTLVWLCLIGATGIVNITHYPGIFRAFDPSRAVMLFVRTGNYDILAGVLLALTGCEALFANLGQFNMLSIQLSFSCITYPALMLAYLGQGAQLIVDGENVISNVFYQSIPGPSNGPLFWIVFVFGILATLVASQALITATFSLIQQVINMKSFPRLRMVCTSETVQGQVYIPAVNWSLAVITLVVVVAFNSATALTNAYGFAVATVMFTSTTLMAVQCHYVKHLPLIVSAMFLVFFGFFDGLFWGAALRKVPEGAWVPLMMGVILVTFMVFWTWAKGLEDEFDGANRKSLRRVIVTSEMQTQLGQESALESSCDNEVEEQAPDTPGASDTKALYLAADAQNPERELTVLPIIAVFHKFASGKGIPHSFVGFLRRYPALPRVVIFLSVRVMAVARIPREDRFVVAKVRSLDGFYGVTYRIGFREAFDIDVNTVVDDICALERQARSIYPGDAEEVVREIRDAATRMTHIVPHYNVVSKRVGRGNKLRVLYSAVNWVRELLIEEFYHRLAIMFPETANWQTSADEILHVGITACI